jgi:hypothetical protein
MYRHEANLVEHTTRAAVARMPAGYDGETHYRALIAALLPAAAILLAAAVVMARLLSA